MKVKSCKPAGHQILIRRLSNAEIAGTTLHLADNVKLQETPQAYILAFGPMVDSEKYGLEVGDRVLVTGVCTPVPVIEGQQFDLIEPHMIKGILEEE